MPAGAGAVVWPSKGFRASPVGSSKVSVMAGALGSATETRTTLPPADGAVCRLPSSVTYASGPSSVKPYGLVFAPKFTLPTLVSVMPSGKRGPGPGPGSSSRRSTCSVLLVELRMKTYGSRTSRWLGTRPVVLRAGSSP